MIQQKSKRERESKTKKMNCKVLSSNDISYHLSPIPNKFLRKSILKPCGAISFNTHLRNSGFSTKTSSSGSSYKSRTKAAMYAPAQTTESFYELLGISESVTLSEIKKAYKQLARKYHPDVSPADRMEEYTQRFILVQEAYETLSDPHTRALYDRDLSEGLHLAFSARKRVGYDQERGDWKNRWQSQLTELKRMSRNNDSRGSWGARMRRQRSESFAF